MFPAPFLRAAAGRTTLPPPPPPPATATSARLAPAAAGRGSHFWDRPHVRVGFAVQCAAGGPCVYHGFAGRPRAGRHVTLPFWAAS